MPPGARLAVCVRVETSDLGGWVALPVYVYQCDGCGSRIEKRQAFTDAPLTECNACGGALRKVLQPASVIYKGSGFYSTDSRSKSGGNGADRSGNGSNGSKPEDSPPVSPPKAAEEAATKPASTEA